MSCAMPGRVFAVMVGSAALCGVAMATPVDELAGCRAIQDDAARLACYDSLADGAEPVLDSQDNAARHIHKIGPKSSVASAGQQPPQAAQSAAPAIDSEQAAIDEFGGQQYSKPKHDEPAKLKEISSSVAALHKSASGKAVVTLENGQVWRQLNSDTAPIRASNAVGKSVIVKKGAFGSHKMKIDGGRAFKVTRIQ